MRSDIDVLLLDFGGVCIFHPNELHRRTEELLGLDAGSLTWLGAADPSTDELWRRTTSGEISEREYWNVRAAELSERAGRTVSRRDYFDMLYDPPTRSIVRAEAYEVVAEARAAGYGVSVLSNDLSTFQGPEWPAKVEFLTAMDHVVDGERLGVLKPDARAYAGAADIVGVDADRMLFVDDLPANVEGATSAGLEAMWFDIADAPGCWRAVAERLGLS